MEPVKVEKQERLDSEVSGKYIGNKWGGKYLRAPDIYWTIIEKAGDKLVRLGDIAEVRFGIKTGANDFFFVEDVTETVDFRTEMKRIRNHGDYTDIERVIKSDLRIIQSKLGDLWLIEKEFLKPVIKSPREVKSIIIDPSVLKYCLFMCDKEKRELKGRKSLDFIRWGEKNDEWYNRNQKRYDPPNNRPSCKGRPRWWDLGSYNKAHFIWFKAFNDRVFVPSNVDKLPNSDRFFSIMLHDDINTNEVAITLNNTICSLTTELYGRANLGEGVLDNMTYEAEMNLIIHPEILDRKTLMLVSQCGLSNPSLKNPVSTQPKTSTIQ